MARNDETSKDSIILGESLDILSQFQDESFQMIYIDPPFNTGKQQVRKTLETTPDEDGDRTGFQGRRFKTRLLAESSYRDTFEDYLAFLEPRFRHAWRLLEDTGTMYFHIDYREAHYCKLLLDEIFSGSNADEVDELIDLVRRLNRDGLTILVIEHNVRAIRAVADRVVAMNIGQVISVGTADEVFSDPGVIESYLGQHSKA